MRESNVFIPVSKVPRHDLERFLKKAHIPKYQKLAIMAVLDRMKRPTSFVYYLVRIELKQSTLGKEEFNHLLERKLFWDRVEKHPIAV